MPPPFFFLKSQLSSSIVITLKPRVMGTYCEPPPRNPWEGVSPHKAGHQIPTPIKVAIREEYASRSCSRLFL